MQSLIQRLLQTTSIIQERMEGQSMIVLFTDLVKEGMRLFQDVHRIGYIRKSKEQEGVGSFVFGATRKGAPIPTTGALVQVPEWDTKNNIVPIPKDGLG